MYDDESDDDNIALNFTLTHESFENDLYIRHVISMASHEHDNVYNNRQRKLLFEQFVQPNKKNIKTTYCRPLVGKSAVDKGQVMRDTCLTHAVTIS